MTNPISNNSRYFAKMAGQDVTLPTCAISRDAELLEDVVERIEALSHIGRYLSTWNCTTGLPSTNPQTIPYTYNTGDYYVVSAIGAGATSHGISMSGTTTGGEAYSVSFSIVNSVSTAYTTVAGIIEALHAAGHTGHSGTCPATGTCGEYTVGYVAEDNEQAILFQTASTEMKGMVTTSEGTATITDTTTAATVNYKPNGTSYTGAASTTTDSSTIAVGDMYRFDGAVWELLKFSAVLQRYRAAADQDVIDATKQDKLPTVTNDRYLHTNASTGALEWSAVSGGASDIFKSATGGYSFAEYTPSTYRWDLKRINTIQCGDSKFLETDEVSGGQRFYLYHIKKIYFGRYSNLLFADGSDSTSVKLTNIASGSIASGSTDGVNGGDVYTALEARVPSSTASDSGKILEVNASGNPTWSSSELASETWTFTLSDSTTVTKSVAIWQ